MCISSHGPRFGIYGRKQFCPVLVYALASG